MRKEVAAAAGVLLVSAPAVANSTYTGTRTVGNETAFVTLTTDGSTGALAANNIVSFSVDFSDGSSIAGNSNNVSTQGGALFASTQQIGFNFSFPVGPNGTYFALVGQDALVQNSLYCVQIQSACGASGTGEVINTFDGVGQTQFTAQSTFVPLFTLASTETSAVPEPATWTMMLLGFGALGLSIRRPRHVRVPQLA
jgi:hypothetical protein